MANKLRVALIGGGTGGHIYPIIAVVQKLREHAARTGVDLEMRYYGEAGEYTTLLQEAGIKITPIAASKLRRYFSPLNLIDFFKFFIGFFQAVFKLYFFMPDVAFSKGGPGALAVVYAARFYLTPLVVHESDTIPGLTNKISARKAKIVDLAFNAATRYFQKVRGQIHVVGNPIRAEILQTLPSDQAKTKLGLDPAKPVVFVWGGSQGSEPMNDFILNNLEQLLLKFQIVHSVGKQNYSDYKGQYEFVSKNFSPLIKAGYRFSEYFDKNIGEVLDAADLVVSRAGAGAIFEIAAKGKPSIIVPFPEAAANHQRENAYAYAQSGAAVVIEQANLLLSVFLSQTDKIFSSPEAYKKMSAAAHDFATPDAANQVATHILELWQV